MTSKDKNIKTLADLKPDQRNARKHNPRNIGMISNALQEVGVARSGVIDEDGNILAGNGTYEALAEAGFEKVKVIEADGNEWVVVKRRGLTPEQKTKLALYDNRSAELAEWDAENMGLMKDDFPDIFDKMFSDDELRDILSAPEGDRAELEGEDDAPMVPADARTNPGDVYDLGPHRLVCGDCSNKEHIDALMEGGLADMVFTDPPYGVDYTGKTKQSLKIQNDKDTSAFAKMLEVIPIAGGTPVYVCCPAGNNFIEFEMPFQKHCHHSCTIIWNKNSMVMGHGDYHYKHEPIMYGWKLGGTHKFYGDRTQTTVWDIDRPTASKEHPTMKPVALVEQALLNSSLEDHWIFDPFGGSGTTLIASEKLKRKALLMEIDPIYCDVIVDRYCRLFHVERVTLNGVEIEWTRQAEAEPQAQ